MRRVSVLALGLAALLLAACGDDEPDEPGGGSDPACGNGKVEPGEQCDDGVANSDTDPGACRTNCRTAYCGDGVVDSGEDCDGVALGSETCGTRGFQEGSLACSSSCSFDESDCSTCGNGTLEGDEKCDGTEFGSNTCSTEQAGQHGKLTCNADCTVDASQCHTCGDGTVDEGAGEDCEPASVGTCKERGFAFGQLACGEPACKLDDGACRAYCGNGILEPGEECDGSDLPSGKTCASENASTPGGDIECAPSCRLTQVHCHRCGNGELDPGEECDGTDLGGVECDTLWGDGTSGTLGCTQSCKFDSSLCEQPSTTCGDGVVDDHEQCDGNNLDGRTCADLDPANYGGGHLACTSNCLFDTSACEPRPCGNGDAEPDYGEHCDGDDLLGQSCESLGFADGELACTDWCTFDRSGCVGQPTCGNGVVEEGEDCDTVVPPGASCEELGFLPGGSVTCASNCILDVSNCSRCGDGRLDYEEQCDGDQLRGLACSDFGRFGGELSCRQDCTFDASGCNDCGNGVIDTGEACEVGSADNPTCTDLDPALPDGEPTCSPVDCTLDGSSCHNCGNGQLEGPEDCDPLPTTTCADHGFDHGLVLCNPDCVGVDTSGCWREGDGECNIGAGENLSNSVDDCGWKQLSGGERFACGVKNDGSVFCWGSGLGYPSYPTRIALLGKAVQVSAGFGFACAVLDTGRVNCWGGGTSGQLGNGDWVSSADPVEVSNVMGATGVRAAHYTACAWQSGGPMWCWGSDNKGQLGNGDAETDNKNVPVLVSAAGAVNQVGGSAPGYGVGTGPFIAVRTDGSVVGWGPNVYNPLGLGSGAPSQLDSPVTIPMLGSGNLYVSGNGNSTCVIDASAHVLCSGVDFNGKLGNGDSTGDVVTHGPVDMANMTEPIAQVANGLHHTCARTTSGAVWCWGDGSVGELGQGDYSNAQSPLEVTALTVAATDLTVGSSNQGHPFSCSVLTDGSAWCWGRGANGQLGNGNTQDEPLPVQVIEPSN